jgi:hypothetical protein
LAQPLYIVIVITTGPKHGTTVDPFLLRNMFNPALMDSIEQYKHACKTKQSCKNSHLHMRNMAYSKIECSAVVLQLAVLNGGHQPAVIVVNVADPHVPPQSLQVLGDVAHWQGECRVLGIARGDSSQQDRA